MSATGAMVDKPTPVHPRKEGCGFERPRSGNGNRSVSNLKLYCHAYREGPPSAAIGGALQRTPLKLTIVVGAWMAPP